MKQFISKAKDLSQRAAEWKAAVERLPPKVAEVRETIAATAGQLQQLKTEVQSSVTDLKADSEQRISQALQEINSSREVFLEAGFDLDGVDLEISPVQRLLVHLDKLEEVSPAVIRSLIAANKPRRTTHALLTALLQAQETAATVDLAGLDCVELVVGIGPIPSVRLCWRAAAVSAETAKPTPSHSPQVSSAAPAAPTPSAFSQSTFFERQAVVPSPSAIATAPSEASAPVVPPAVPHQAKSAETPADIETTRTTSPAAGTPDPLARFKKMPDLSKH
ncbi:MAG: hypothetical protein KJ070_13970 [Verrucomicrobia bacterium]|nr:hypothetical protein [Verrucomicrobiota bacterium]